MAISLFRLASSAALFAATLVGAPASAQAPVDGGALFRQRCQGCHSVTPGAEPLVAPNLAGVVGRHAAATGYRYSDALKASGLTWSPAALDRYLTDPMHVVPGTRMVVRITDPAERAAVIRYLASTGR